MPSSRFVVVDVFTDTPLEGNQLAVFTDARELPERLLQPLAKEIGFSETVYVYPPQAGGHASIRIFTPARELRFAGHPVLGTAFVLGAPMQLVEIVLETKSGLFNKAKHDADKLLALHGLAGAGSIQALKFLQTVAEDKASTEEVASTARVLAFKLKKQLFGETAKDE